MQPSLIFMSWFVRHYNLAYVHILYFLFHDKVFLKQGGLQFQSHPVRDRDDFRSKCVPLRLHGDGTPAMGVGKAWGKMIDVWSWTSILCRGTTQLTIFLIYCVHAALRSAKEGHNTLEVAFRKMVWSFDALWEGTWPVFDWNNVRMNYAKAHLS